MSDPIERFLEFAETRKSSFAVVLEEKQEQESPPIGGAVRNATSLIRQ